MPKLLLTGALGFTGRHFIQAAEQAGYEIHSLSADLTDVAAVNAEVAAVMPEYVVHLAAISAVMHADEEEIYRVNLLGTLSLLRALAALREVPKMVLLASSANVYGNSARVPIDEAVCPRPTNHYSISKLAMESMSSTFATRLKIVIARPFNYTGVGHDTRFVIPKLVEHFKNRVAFVELGNIEVEREFNDVRTVCEAYLRLLQKGESEEVYNICSGRPLSLKKIIETLRQITGHDLQVRINSDFIRPNEIRSLCGNPAKLKSCIGNLHYPSIEETLHWMLLTKI